MGRPPQISVSRSVARRIAADLPPVILITAPAGCGKTTLAQELTRTAEAECVLLAVDRRMADPARFLSAVSTALSGALPRRTIPPLASEDIRFAEA